MHVDGLEDILDEFPPSFNDIKPLCRKIQVILFPLLKNGALFTRTPANPEKLYEPIIEAFDDTIPDIAVECRGGIDKMKTHCIL